jgi:hypothetical protein
MNSEKGFRKAKGGFLRVAAGTAVLIVATISTAAVWAMGASGSGAPSASFSRSAQAGASVSLAGLALTFVGVLVALLVVVLTVYYGRRRIARRRAGGRRAGTHAKSSGPRAGNAIRSVTGPVPLNRPAGAGGYWSTDDAGFGSPDLPLPVAGAPEPDDEYPSWPGPPGPYALHPDHPSWPGSADPRWAAAEVTLREDDYPSWPERQGPPWPDAAPPVSENGDRGSLDDLVGHQDLRRPSEGVST